jgi:2,3,4,5-tetrahydropyridine-2,6-dicarboxylate N-succinyltransferase
MAEPREQHQFVKSILRLNGPILSPEQVQDSVRLLASLSPQDLRQEPSAWPVFAEFLSHLTRGRIRAAQPIGGDRWQVNSWVKDGIMIGFKLGGVVPLGGTEEQAMFSDRPAFPLRPITSGENVRIVPVSAVRAGAYLEDGVTIMAGAYVNVGARIGKGTLVDSFALVGSSAQIGENCHLSMHVGVGGVIEPAQAMPCIIEDEVTMFGGSEIAEGVRLRKRAVLGMGVTLASGVEVHDLVEDRLIEPVEGVLEIPEGAIVIPGSIPISGSGYAVALGLHKKIAIIRKYRDSKTDAKTALEQALR